jgi:hypothetical protein
VVRSAWIEKRVFLAFSLNFGCANNSDTHWCYKTLLFLAFLFRPRHLPNVTTRKICLNDPLPESLKVFQRSKTKLQPIKNVHFLGRTTVTTVTRQNGRFLGRSQTHGPSSIRLRRPRIRIVPNRRTIGTLAEVVLLLQPGGHEPHQSTTI